MGVWGETGEVGKRCECGKVPKVPKGCRLQFYHNAECPAGHGVDCEPSLRGGRRGEALQRRDPDGTALLCGNTYA